MIDGSHRSGCSNRGLGDLLTGYSFGGLSEGEREKLEEHLLECEVCWQEFQGLEQYVRILRTDPRIKPALKLAQLVSVVGLSGRVTRPYAGHLAFVAVMTILYASLWVLGLWTELGYAYDRFGPLLWRLSLPVGLFAAECVGLAFGLDVRATRAGDSRGLLRSAGVTAVGLGALAVVLTAVLPAERTILASFETRTAAAGYLKDALFIFLPPLIFLLPTFHTVIQLQRDLRAGRHEEVFAFLTRHPEAVSPRGVFYLSPTFLTVLLLLETVRRIVGANYMLDALTPGPYAHLFTMVSYVTTAVWIAVTAGGVGWYVANLNELKRECIAVRRLT